MKKLITIILLLLLLTSSLYSQLIMSMSSDKDNYEYGEKIELRCKITNPADTTFRFFAGSHNTCQAEFSFNDFNSWEHTRCLTLTQLLVFKPFSSLVYKWMIDPMVYGLPDNDGVQQIICTYYFDLIDTIYINSPQFLGGQLSVGYPKSNADSIQYIKDSLGIDVLHQSDYGDKYSEHWQVVGYQIDSLIARYDEDAIFNYVEKAVLVECESMMFENPLEYFPLEIGNKWQYKCYYVDTWENDTSNTYYYRSEEVIGDTVLDDEYKYFTIRYGDGGKHYLRFDPLTNIVYEPSGYEFLNLSAKPDSLWKDNYGITNNMYLDTLEVGEFDLIRPAKIYQQGYFLFKRTLAKGIGKCFEEYGDLGQHTINSLVYASIIGSEYGTPIKTSDFYPLHIGDKWIYEWSIDDGGQIYKTTSEIIDKVVMPNGKEYYQRLEANESTFERIDSATGIVYQYDDTTDSINFEKVRCYLKARQGDVMETEEGLHQVYSGYYQGSIFEKDSDFLTFSIPEITTYIETFAYGFGSISRVHGWERETTKKLSGCVINGIVYGDTTLTTIEINHGNLPIEYSLGQNYPNPFNPSTTISYSIPMQSKVELKVYDVLGREVATLVNKKQQAGSYEVEFDASNLGSGVYFYQLRAGSFVESRKLVLLK